jgi:hypothetical protein
VLLFSSVVRTAVEEDGPANVGEVVKEPLTPAIAPFFEDQLETDFSARRTRMTKGNGRGRKVVEPVLNPRRGVLPGGRC